MASPSTLGESPWLSASKDVAHSEGNDRQDRADHCRRADALRCRPGSHDSFDEDFLVPFNGSRNQALDDLTSLRLSRPAKQEGTLRDGELSIAAELASDRARVPPMHPIERVWRSTELPLPPLLQVLSKARAWTPHEHSF